jgi:threonine dehydrogenase-like Zn-dependent dehydrogenase
MPADGGSVRLTFDTLSRQTVSLADNALFSAIAYRQSTRADAARVRKGSTVVVVGDGAVGLMGVLAAKQMGADRIIAVSRHKTRQDLALEFGATDIVSERGEKGVAAVKKLTRNIGGDSVLECVGTQESMVRPSNVHIQGQ